MNACQQDTSPHAAGFFKASDMFAAVHKGIALMPSADTDEARNSSEGTKINLVHEVLVLALLLQQVQLVPGLL